MTATTKYGNWDFRSSEEKKISQTYEEKGFVIQNGDIAALDKIKIKIVSSFTSFSNQTDDLSLEQAHNSIDSKETNNLRLHVMRNLSTNPETNYQYFQASKKLINYLCGNELAMQKRIGLSVNFPNNEGDILSIHADTWQGVSPYELNIWIPMVDCTKTMCLYILPRNRYNEMLNDNKGLLSLSADDLYKKLEPYLEWIEIKYGEVLAFDQSLPHGYELNTENNTHWSLNCRFKGLHTPYWDKKLGEYFMPITAKSCTKLGMDYKHPEEWL